MHVRHTFLKSPSISICTFKHSSCVVCSCSIRNYYVTQLSFYLSLSITQLISVRRKSFRQLVAHHCIAVLLLIFSYVDNFVRIGCIILIAHDIADVWLETVKLLNYTKCGRLTNFVFAIFAIHFFATRSVLVLSP